jgi:hypothetical protein
MCRKLPLPFGNFLTIPKAHFVVARARHKRSLQKTRFMGPPNNKVLTLTKENAWLTNFSCFAVLQLDYAISMFLFFTDNKTFPIFIQTYQLYIRQNINTLSFLLAIFPSLNKSEGATLSNVILPGFFQRSPNPTLWMVDSPQISTTIH